MSMSNELKAGFTGDIESRTGMVADAKKAARYVKNEAGAVVATAQDHPTATGTAFLVFGAAAFLAGYLLGTGRRDW